ncbi:MAG: hypothetical protein IT348_11190 [Candidatus Eisenbacteria bacterium]|nr:hypothetical protein [Candidatus Eisenbacteria bacterium]
MGNRGRLWGFDDEARKVLIDATTEIPELRAVIARAEVRADLGGFWVVQASGRELNDMYDLVGALMDSTRSRKKQDLLDGLLARLCTSIDGF